jgi:hypothetical protein
MKVGDLVKMICEINDTDEDYNSILSTETRVGLYNKIIDMDMSFFGDKHQVYVEGELREYSEKLWKVEVLNER